MPYSYDTILARASAAVDALDRAIEEYVRTAFTEQERTAALARIDRVRAAAARYCELRDYNPIRFWAQRGHTRVGPFSTREQALAVFRKKHPVKTATNRNKITTGYGAFGPALDIRWHDAREPS